MLVGGRFEVYESGLRCSVRSEVRIRVLCAKAFGTDSAKRDIRRVVNFVVTSSHA